MILVCKDSLFTNENEIELEVNLIEFGEISKTALVELPSGDRKEISISKIIRITDSCELNTFTCSQCNMKQNIMFKDLDMSQAIDKDVCIKCSKSMR